MRSRLLILSLAALSACEPDASGEARMFLDRLDRLDVDDPSAEREPMVDNLANMPLANDEIRTARDVCVRAHRELLEAESLQARARAAVEEFPEEADIPLSQRLRIERDIRGSNHAIVRSRELFESCQNGRRRLDRQYRRSR